MVPTFGNPSYFLTVNCIFIWIFIEMRVVGYFFVYQINDYTI